MVASIQSIEKTSQSLKPQAAHGSQQTGNITELDKLQFITALQSTLELEQLLHTFLENLNNLVRVDGIFYQEFLRHGHKIQSVQFCRCCGFCLRFS